MRDPFVRNLRCPPATLQDSAEGIRPPEGQVEVVVLKDNGDSDGDGIAEPAKDPELQHNEPMPSR